MTERASAADEIVRARYALLSAVVVGLGSVAASYPGLPPLDAGDFVTAATTFGVPHATGFPVYLEASRLFAWLPIGNAAARIAWLSAFGSAVAAAALVWVTASAARLRHGTAAVAVAGSLVFFFAHTLVLHARVAEVYALNVALVGAALVAVERLAATRDPRWRGAVALAVGLGLANHALFRLWLPVFVGAAVVLVDRPARRRGWFGLLVVGALSVAAYLAIYAAASAQPVHNWGDPSSATRWWAHVTARDIRTAFADEMRPTWFSFGAWSGRLGQQLWGGLGVHAGLALAGVVMVARRRHAVAAVLVVLLAIEWGYATVINPMGLRDYQNGQLLAAAAACLSGAAIGMVVERLAHRRAAGVSPSGAALVGTVSAVVAALTFVGSARPAPAPTGRDWSAEDVAALHLAFAMPESVTVPTSDTAIAALLHAHVAVDARPDVAVIGRHELTTGPAATRAARLAPFDVVPADVVAAWGTEGLGDGAARAALVLSSVGTRAIYWEATGSGDELPRDLRLVHEWPMGRVVTGDAADDECAAPSRSYCRPESDAQWGAAAREVAGSDGYYYRRWLARRWAYRGARALRGGRMQESGAAFERAVALAPDVSSWLTGLAVALANTGRLDEALSIQLLAVRRDPLSERALSNAIEFADALGESDEVQRLRRHAARVARPE